MKKDFVGFNHGTGTIKVEGNHVEARPTEIHLKEDGTITNGPSLCMVMDFDILPYRIIGQISVEMFNEGLKDLGYKISKIDETA